MPVVRSTTIADSRNIFHSAHSLGFEFTHHDVLDNEEHRASVERKIERVDELRKKRDVTFLYFHRKGDYSDIKELKSRLLHFSKYYENESSSCRVVLFYQELFKSKHDRRLDFSDSIGPVKEFVFHTKDIWAGKDQDVFWARKDDDLFEQMFSQLDTHTSRVT